MDYKKMTRKQLVTEAVTAQAKRGMFDLEKVPRIVEGHLTGSYSWYVKPMKKAECIKFYETQVLGIM